MTASGDRTPGPAAEVFDGVAVPAGRYTAVGAERPHSRWVFGVVALTLAVTTGAVAGWDKVATKESVYECPPECGRPPTSLPVSAMPRFVAPDGSFSVGYPGPGDSGGAAFQVTTDPSGVSAVKTSGDPGQLHLFAVPAAGRVASRVVADLLAKDFVGADIAYEVPNATVGYQLGYGVVVTVQRPGALSVSRAVLMAAVKNDLALVGTAEGPFHRFSPDFGPGVPSAANVEIAMTMSKYTDSFRWRGDPPR